MNPSAADLTCRELVELVTEYLEQTLPEQERARFEAHLEECPYCRIYLGQMREVIRRLGRLGVDTIEPDVRDGLLVAFRGWRSGR